MKVKKLFSGWYIVKKDLITVYTIVKSKNGWNLYEGIDTLKGHIDSFETLKEVKRYLNTK